MTEYKFEKCTVRIHGNTPENIREATEKFIKGVIRCKKRKTKEKIKSCD